MMIDTDSDSNLGSQTLNVGLQNDLTNKDNNDINSSTQMTDLKKWNDHAEDKPDINHLDIGSLWETIEDTNIPEEIRADHDCLI